MPQISIIIPVYGAEKYLHRCLNSILAQTFTDWVSILVDDGSKDRSGAICDEYAQKDSRFRVFHKENGGVSSARQFGMERMLESDSEYFIHADPDDWIEPYMLQKLYGKAIESGADMVICDYYANSEGGQKYIEQNPGSDDPLKVLDSLFEGLHGSLWNKMIRTDVYFNADIRFPVGLNFCEDFYVNVRILQNISKVAYLPEAFYHYDQVINSQAETKNKNSKNIDFTRTEIVRLCREVVPDNLKTFSYYLFEIRNAYAIIRWGGLSNTEFHKLFSNIPNKLLLKRHADYWHTFIVILAIKSGMGLARVSYVVKKYYTIRLAVALKLRSYIQRKKYVE